MDANGGATSHLGHHFAQACWDVPSEAQLAEVHLSLQRVASSEQRGILKEDVTPEASAPRHPSYPSWALSPSSPGLCPGYRVQDLFWGGGTGSPQLPQDSVSLSHISPQTPSLGV